MSTWILFLLFAGLVVADIVFTCVLGKLRLTKAALTTKKCVAEALETFDKRYKHLICEHDFKPESSVGQLQIVLDGEPEPAIPVYPGEPGELLFCKHCHHLNPRFELFESGWFHGCLGPRPGTGWHHARREVRHLSFGPSITKDLWYRTRQEEPVRPASGPPNPRPRPKARPGGRNA